MASRKHFEEIASFISDVKDNRDRWRLTSQMAKILAQLNNRFDSEKFREACNPKGESDDRHTELRA